MGNPQGPADWPDDDDTDWVRLWTLSRDLYSSYLAEFGELVESGRARPADLTRFAERCLRSARCLADLDARLPGLGLSLARFVELREGAIAAEHAAIERTDQELDDGTTKYSAEYRERRHPIQPGPRSHQLANLILSLYLRGLEDERIACALDVHESWPRIVRDRTKIHPDATAVVAGHIAGWTLGRISQEIGVAPSTALRILRLIGEQPQGAKTRVDARARGRDIVRLREKEHLSYKEIADRLGCSMDTVKNVLRRKRRPRYGKGGA